MDIKKPNWQTRIAQINLHKSIEKGDFSAIQTFAETFPNEKYVYNKEFKSAVAASLELKDLKIYELLIEKGFLLGPHENIQAILDEERLDFVKIVERKKMFEIHKQYSISLNHVEHKHLIILHSKCKLSHNTAIEHRRSYHQLILTALMELNEIVLIEPLLRLLASCECLEILFDFNHESVDNIDPRKTEWTFGTTYPSSNYITIGAKLLFDDCYRFEVYATMTHEFCHFAMKMIYQNHCRPFHVDHEFRKRELNRIINLCYQNKDENEIISAAFNDESKLHQEIIVRVPHLLALHKNNSEKLKEIRKKYSKLFEFYENQTFVDLKKECEMIEEKRLIEEINELSGVLSEIENSKLSKRTFQKSKLNMNFADKNVCFSSNCPKLTMHGIYLTFMNIDKQDVRSTRVFITLDSLKNEEIFGLITTASKSVNSPSIIIDCDGKTAEQIESCFEKLKTQNITKRIIFVTNGNKFDNFGFEITRISLKHSWTELRKSQKNKVLNDCYINFQGKRMNLKEFMGAKMKKVEHLFIQQFLAYINNPKFKLPKEIVDKFERYKNFPDPVRPEKVDNLMGIPLRLLLESEDIKVGDEIVQLSEFYIQRNYKTLEQDFSFDNIINISKAQQVMFMIDDPGNGKTLEFKNLTIKLKEKFPSQWIILIDLKEFTDVFECDENSSIVFSCLEEVGMFLSDIMLKFDEFSSKVFMEMFSENRVTMLLDGFDEISPVYKQFVMVLMIAVVEKTMNKIWVSSRPHCAQDLRDGFENLNPFQFELKPFSQIERKNFFRSFLSKTVQESFLENLLAQIENFVKSLEKQNPLVNPLLLRIIGETCTSTKSIDFNYYSLYNKFFDKMFDKFFEKGPLAKNDIKTFAKKSTNILEFHHHKAFETLFNTKSSIFKVLNSFFAKNSNLTNEQMVRLGIMFDIGSGRLQFVHRTYAEFFVADFIIKTLFLQETLPSEEMRKFVKFMFFFVLGPSNYSGMIRRFLDHAFVTNFFVGDCHDAELYLNPSFEECFVVLASEGHFNLLRFVSKTMLRNNQKLLRFWKGEIHRNVTVLMAAAMKQPLEFMLKIISFAKEVFDRNQLIEVLKQKNDDSENVFHFAVKNNDHKVFEFLVEEFKRLSFEGALDCLMSNNEHGRNILFNAIEYENQNKFHSVFNVLTVHCDSNQLKTMLNSSDMLDETLLHYACKKFTEENLEKFCGILKEYFDINELKQLVCTTSNLGVTSLMIAAKNSNQNVYKTFWTFVTEVFKESSLNLLLDFDNFVCNAFHFAVENKNTQNFDFVYKVYEKLVDMKEMLTYKNVNRANALFHAVSTCKDNENQGTIKSLFNKMQKLFDVQTLKQLLLEQNNVQETILQFAGNSESKFKVFLPFLLKNFAIEDDIEIHLLFLTAAQKFSMDSFKICEELILSKDIFKMLNECGKNILENARMNIDTRVFDFFLRQAESCLTHDELEECTRNTRRVFDHKIIDEVDSMLLDNSLINFRSEIKFRKKAKSTWN